MEKPAILGGVPVRNTPLQYGKQYLDKSDISAVVKVLESDFLTCGPEIKRIEEKLAKVCGAKYCTSISNGTAALHAACFAAGIKAGDEVITTPITFAASANAVLYCGAKPVFADIDKENWNIRPKSVEKLITSNTKAVIAVDYTGQAAPLDELMEICKKNNLVLIEDAAHSIGTIYKGKPVGSIADMTTFSFHPVKTVTCGEGGAITTNNENFAEKLSLFRAHGITRDKDKISSDDPWLYEQQELGYNYRITDFQAALLSSQLDKLPVFSSRRKAIVKAYNKAFSDMPQIIPQGIVDGSDTVNHLYVLRLNLEKLSVDRREIFDALYAENIHCNVHYIPVYYHPYYKALGYNKGICPNAEKLYDEIISIPLFYGMNDKDVDDVISAVKKVIAYYSL